MHIFSSFFFLKLSLFLPILPPFVSFSLLSISSPPLFAYSSPSPCHLTHPFPSVSLRHQGAYPPRQDAWQGSRWNTEQMTNLSLVSRCIMLSLAPSNRCPARGPPQPPFFQRLPILSEPHWYSDLPGLRSTSSRHEGFAQTTQEERRWAKVPMLIPNLKLVRHIKMTEQTL